MADYSFIAEPAKPPSLLEQAGQYGQAAVLANENRLFQQDFQGKMALGRAAQGAIGPDGSFDSNKFLAALGQDPRGAFLAPDAAKQALERKLQEATIGQTHAATQLTQTQTGAAQFKLAQDRRSAITGALLPLVRNIGAGQPIDDDQITKTGAALLSNPAFADAQSQQILSQEISGLLGTPGPQRSAMVLNHYIGANADPSGVQTAIGSQSTINTGAQTNIVQGGGVAPPQITAQMTNTLSPEAEATPREFVDPAGAPHQVPTSALVTPTGQPRPDVSGLTGPHGETTTNLSPAAGAAATTIGQGNANMAIGLQQRAAQVPTNKALLGNMEGLIENFEPGPQSQWWKGLGQLAQEYHLPMPGAPPANKTAAQEEFSKLAFQLAQSQFQALGGTGTDSKLDSTMHTSPSELLTRYGNKGIISILKGNEDAIHAQNEAWQKWESAGHGPETYGKFQSQFNNIYDPRVFQSQYMTPAERQQSLKGMSAAERTKFETDWKLAHKLGWIE